MNHSFLALCSYLSSLGGRQHIFLFHIVWILKEKGLSKVPQKMAKCLFLPSVFSCTSSHQLLLINCLRTCQTDARIEHCPVLFARGVYFQIKYKAAAPEHESSFPRVV